MIDADKRLDSAREAQLAGKTEEAAFNAQISLELYFKALMDALGIDYPKSHSIDETQVTQILTELAGRFKRSEPSFFDDDGFGTLCLQLVRCGLVYRSLSQLRNSAQYGFAGQSAGAVFDDTRLKAIVDSTIWFIREHHSSFFDAAFYLGDDRGYSLRVATEAERAKAGRLWGTKTPPGPP